MVGLKDDASSDQFSKPQSVGATSTPSVCSSKHQTVGGLSAAATLLESPGDCPASSIVGRIKDAPVSNSALKSSAMSALQLSELCFSFNVPASISSLDGVPQPPLDAATVSSSSSTCTRESDAFSDAEIGVKINSSSGNGSGNAAASEVNNNHHSHSHSNPKQTLPFNRAASERLNAKVSLRKISRNGRSKQRWETDADTNETVRMVTGCVPILRGGKIMFCSASRKPEWILPKGGWEIDEELEESAVRETFEEAGVLGMLGPKLSEIQYETRKAKKRRLELKEFQQQQAKISSSASVEAILSDGERDVSAAGVEDQRPNMPNGSAIASTVFRESGQQQPQPISTSPPITISNEVMSRIRAQASAIKQSSDETASVASSTVNGGSQHSQVRLSFFPLYVSKVFEKWPENGRSRKAVDIDEAIAMTESRPEFQSALLEVKKRGLHRRTI